ncbi:MULTISPECIES: triose-phosphate isomerase [unclassified Neisseria]|uniref:triose-phosphate isomerase n=1 Tax=unclassified Neisseria TaxID=2623750 RepID=UPI002665CA58|nr:MULTISPECIES: triose-phosphate isomerase [unclassified Neisseria]MDO1510398.1 triose-phosphate isomerase [Neisseria sp. MVDL19-042950]MDO1516567.1 triose-phosphate isomerase [Neisseria sp. MVDL18-041461]MDO1563640.1 triose-phosphate isomerase [Neisseria sp. MVDL20-010259]
MWEQKWVIGNWKMNGRLQNNNALMHRFRILPSVDRVAIGLAAPTVYLLQLHNAMQIVLGNRILTCAQDVSRFAGNGAYTGEVSAEMMADVGVDIVLIGHSERSLYFGEKNEIQRQKMENVLNVGLIPLLCVGESLEEREAGHAQDVIAHQLSILKGLDTKKIVVAYEPVWAIGTGKVATTEQIAEMHAFIYKQILSLCGDDVKIRVLYGGSVNANNAADIFAVPCVDGALVGGASLSYDSFTAIINAAQES